MTFEQFEAMRTNLATEIRRAERSGDGNAAMAASIVRDALEGLPLKAEAQQFKGLADTARGLAKARFDALKKDPAYKAAVDDAVPADKYFDKFVVNGVNKNINTSSQKSNKTNNKTNSNTTSTNSNTTSTSISSKASTTSTTSKKKTRIL